jgi:hypothetical protein
MIFLAFTTEVKSQTDFAPGEIMFVGYRSDAPDSFSIVLLRDAVTNTVISITDRGWSNTTGFRTGNIAVEGTISLTLNANLSCGKEIIFAVNNAPAPDVWTAFDATGVSMGTVAITTGTNGPVLDDIGGDQLFIYQTPAPTAGNQASFVTAISMRVIGGNPWAANATNDNNSAYLMASR